MRRIEQRGERFGVVADVARQLGIGVESLRNWVKQAEVDGGTWAGTTTEERRRIAELERENRDLRRANEILKAASAFFATGARPATAEMITFIDTHKAAWGVEPICRLLPIAPSTYYAAKTRPPSARVLADARLMPEVLRVFKDNYEVYGAEKIWRQLRREASTSAGTGWPASCAASASPASCGASPSRRRSRLQQASGPPTSPAGTAAPQRPTASGSPT